VSHPRIYDYELRWEQFMGNGRGVTMHVNGDDWETMRHIWNRVAFREGVSDMTMRNLVVTCNGKPFDPEGTWPRPPMI
jgi:hypothetical protein